MTSLDDVIAQFCRNQGIGGLSANEDGEYHLYFDGGNPVVCFERFQQLHLVSPLDAEPSEHERESEWLRRILNYSLRKMKDNASTPVLLEDGRLALFSRSPMVNLTAAALEGLLEKHVNALEGFRQWLSRPKGLPHGSAFSQLIVRP